VISTVDHPLGSFSLKITMIMIKSPFGQHGLWAPCFLQECETYSPKGDGKKPSRAIGKIYSKLFQFVRFYFKMC
jgi:hypothetical protein